MSALDLVNTITIFRSQRIGMVQTMVCSFSLLSYFVSCINIILEIWWIFGKFECLTSWWQTSCFMFLLDSFFGLSLDFGMIILKPDISFSPIFFRRPYLFFLDSFFLWIFWSYLLFVGDVPREIVWLLSFYILISDILFYEQLISLMAIECVSW